MIYILSFWSDIGFSIKQALRTFSCNIAAVMYNFIVDLYNVFMYTARAEILESSFIQGIYNKVGMILGIFMVFKLSFSLIQSLVDPNKFTDEKNGFGGIIKRSVISIVLLGITPSLFRMAFDLQDLIVGSANNTDNIIYKIIVGTAPSKDAESFGHVIASELYFGFYTENEPLKLNEGLEITYPDSGGVQLEVHNYEYLKTAVESGAMSFKDTVDYLSITSSGQYVINWDGLFAIGFAVFMIYILITYCIQVATRVMQLAYLQLIAPVPILSYISDPDGAFKNWTKQCLTTYLDLFIRLAIIYFIITVSTQILEAVGNTESVLFDSTGLEPGSSTLFWVKIFLIIGLLMFGKRVPELLKDLFPNMGGGAASLGFGPKLPKEVSGFAKGAATLGLGAVVGGAAGLATGIKHGEGIKGKIAGAFGGLGRGAASAKTKGNIFKNAQSGMNSTRVARQRAYEKSHDGSTFWGRNFTAGNAARMVDEFDRETTFNDNYLSGVDSLKKELAKDKFVQKAQAEYESLMQTGMRRDGTVATASDYKNAKDAIKTAEQNAYRNELIKPGSNPGLRAQIDRLDVLGREGQKRGYTGFVNFVSSSDSSKTAADRTTAFWDTEKNVKVENADIKTPGGKKYQQRETAKANASYNKKGK